MHREIASLRSLFDFLYSNEAAIFRGGRRIPFSCDGLTAVPDRAYALFTEKELEKIYNDRNEFLRS